MLSSGAIAVVRKRGLLSLSLQSSDYLFKESSFPLWERKAVEND